MTKMFKHEAARAETLHLLEQKKWWRDSGASVMRRKDMTLRHKVNTLAYLIRNAPLVVAGRPPYGAPDDVWESYEDMQRHPEEYILGTAFIRALILDIVKAAGITPADLGLHCRTTTDPAYGEIWTRR